MRFSTLSFAAVGLLVMGCGGMEPTEEAPQIATMEQASMMVCGEKTTVPLYARDGTKVGDVIVKNNANKVVVKYKMTGKWRLAESKYIVTKFRLLIPGVIGGHLLPNLFWYQDTHNNVKAFTDKLNIPNWWPTGTNLYVAAYAKAVKVNKKGVAGRTAYAMAANSPFRYQVKSCYRDVRLPKGAIDLVGTTPGNPGYWGFTLSKVPDGYDIWDGKWAGWCVEKKVYMSKNTKYTSTVVSSQDTKNLPDRAKNVNWPMVNYLLNNKHPGASTTDIQDAIWHLLGYVAYPTDTEAKWMVDQAKLYGKTFRPAKGQKVAVVFLSAQTVQLVFFEARL
jgi:hypothetical protein